MAADVGDAEGDGDGWTRAACEFVNRSARGTDMGREREEGGTTNMNMRTEGRKI